jgi:outer membrane protein OmpA-like peptidoglycan-associated protein
MGSRFGYDFSQVRVHTDADAARSASAIAARAYTVGSDVVFAERQFAPTTWDGQLLLAHELAHVVQQSGATPPRIQRHLRVTGKKVDIKALFDLLEPASGFTLKHDPKTNEVSIVAAVLKPASVVLAARLAEIINDSKQDAELNLGRNQLGVSFGAFPDSGPLVQEIDIADLTNLEAKASGSAVAFIAHEIVENYHAHTPALQGFNRTVVRAESHEEALEAEALVAGELVRPGRRVADATADMGKGVVRFVDDYEQYFLVIDRTNDVITDARQVSRVNVGTYTIRGFDAGSDVAPASAQPTIETVANAMRMSPTATVRIEAGGQDAKLALRRAQAVQDAILENGKQRNLFGFDLRSARNFNLVASGPADGVVITVDQPDTAVEALRGRLVKQWLSSTRKPPPPAPSKPDWRPRR